MNDDGGKGSEANVNTSRMLTKLNKVSVRIPNTPCCNLEHFQKRVCNNIDGVARHLLEVETQMRANSSNICGTFVLKAVLHTDSARKIAACQCGYVQRAQSSRKRSCLPSAIFKAMQNSTTISRPDFEFKTNLQSGSVGLTYVRGQNTRPPFSLKFVKFTHLHKKDSFFAKINKISVYNSDNGVLVPW